MHDSSSDPDHGVDVRPQAPPASTDETTSAATGTPVSTGEYLAPGEPAPLDEPVATPVEAQELLDETGGGVVPPKPVVALTLVAINVAAYLWEQAALAGGDTGGDLVRVGAIYGPAVAAGQWWRLVTGAFLHDGLTHIGLNMVALLQIGGFLETMVGRVRMLAVYVISLLASGIAVVVFSPDAPTVGASGAIFGCFGAVVAVGLRLGGPGRRLVRAMVPILVINLVVTFAVPFISKAGHLGGLVAGFAVGLVLAETAIRRRGRAPA